ncbi:hypothetical protein [Planococcus halocryophilus]|nr:hypothetical protein [Planococcus halocryophilus]
MSESTFRVVLLICLMIIAGSGIFIGYQLNVIVDALVFLASRG